MVLLGKIYGGSCSSRKFWNLRDVLLQLPARHISKRSYGALVIPSSDFCTPKSVTCRPSLMGISHYDYYKELHGSITLNQRRYQHNDETSNSEIPPAPEQHLVMDTVEGTDGQIVTLTFNRPKAANAMGTIMLTQLQDAISTLKQDNNMARCVILKSSSHKVFSAGADLRERSKMTMDEASSFVTSLRNALTDIATKLPMPIISCVEGVAVGGGLEIALTSDLIIAGKGAIFGLPETSLAIIPGAGGTQRLYKWIGVARAKEMIFTGRRIGADVAMEYGLVQYVEEAGCAEKKALEIAKEIIKNGPLAIQAAKRAIHEGMDAPTVSDALEIERACYQTIIPTSDRLEGLAAFREKREPVYKGS